MNCRRAANPSPPAWSPPAVATRCWPTLAGCWDAGQQAYWVCTLIDESEESPAQSAQAIWETLPAKLPGKRIGLMHGRMRSDEKAAVMAAFKSGELQLLVATTVIEVGVDVANASLMIIENPELLGLAQLHQLRGRIGRGAHKSTCVLLYGEGLSEASRTRLKVIRASQDGFHIAEQDLALRGPGVDCRHPANRRDPVPRRQLGTSRAPDPGHRPGRGTGCWRKHRRRRMPCAWPGPGTRRDWRARQRFDGACLAARGPPPRRPFRADGNGQPTSIISKSSLLTPHSGQTKSSGTSSHLVSGGCPPPHSLGFVIDPAADDALPLLHCTGP